ncbi:MAG: hypothetical protein KGZ74_03565 [Chitinophagaceae bacterium]|nr:hypothetical protein [Chitinophagaceae bacterium]
MYKYILVMLLIINAVVAEAQIQRIQRNKTTPVAPAPAPSVYYISNIKFTIHTGNDNKELNSTFFVFVTENEGIWGKGRDLFGTTSKHNAIELKPNSSTDIALVKYPDADPNAYTLSNLEAKGLRFRIMYIPGFLLDAWKIDAVTIVAEFKDQYGRLHPVSPYRTIRFDNQGGLLTKTKKDMIGVTDSFLNPQSLLITDKQ